MMKANWHVLRWLFGVVSALILLTVSTVLIIKTAGPGWLRAKILSTVSGHCPTCVLYFKSVDISLSRPGLLQFHDVRWVSGEGGRSLFETRLKDLDIDLVLSESSRNRLIMKTIEGTDVDVIYADGPAKKAPERDEKPADEQDTSPERPADSQFQFEIRSTALHNARFRYVHTKNKQTSILHIHDIDGHLNSVGTTSAVRDQLAETRLTGQIEKSGLTELVVAARLRPGPSYVDVLCHVENQNLADLNGFFEKNDGIAFKGTFLNGLANINVRGPKAKSHVEAIYRDAEFNVKPTVQRSAVEAALSTIGASLILTKSNVDWLPIDRRTEVDLKREASEKIVHFILRSAKEGLIDLAKKPDSRKEKGTKK